MPFTLSNLIQVGLPVMSFAAAAQLATEFPFEEEVGNSLIVREPVGVVGAITPWNYPLHQIAAKVAPALAAGCTVVLKPSEVAPLNAFILAEILDDIGLPPGVFNLVTGVGPIVGEAIASHPLVDMVSFTGSTRAGKRVMQLASEGVKRVALELGGKSPNVILEDADLSAAVPAGVAACYINSGQTCSALHPHDRAPVAPGRGRGAGRGDGGDLQARRSRSRPTPASGPLVSATQLERVRGYINKGVDEGATLLTGGAELPDGLDKGYFVRPTVFSNVTRDMTIAQEEIFGPVLSIIPYDSEEEAIEIANDTVYGLAGGVWAGDKEHAERVARQDSQRPGRGQRGRVQPSGAVRRLQAVRHRPRARQVRPRGVPGGQGAPALTQAPHVPHGAGERKFVWDTRFWRARRQARNPSSSILVIDRGSGPTQSGPAGGLAEVPSGEGQWSTEKVFMRRRPLVPIAVGHSHGRRGGVPRRRGRSRRGAPAPVSTGRPRERSPVNCRARSRSRPGCRRPPEDSTRI